VQQFFQYFSYVIYENWDKIKAVVIDAGKTVWGYFESAWDRLKAKFKTNVIDPLNRIINFWKTNPPKTVEEVSRNQDRTSMPAMRADGGYISGPGGPRSDSIPAMLSNGEYVINAKQAAKHRGLLDAINSGRGYAGGGLVTSRLGAIDRRTDLLRTQLRKAPNSFFATNIRAELTRLLKERKAFEDLLVQVNAIQTRKKNASGKSLGEKLKGISSKNFVDKTGDKIFDNYLSPYDSFGEYASGGKVRGPGSGLSDSIPAMLSNGEYVINAKAAARHHALLEAINNGSIGKYAGGGKVGKKAALKAEMGARGRNEVTVNIGLEDNGFGRRMGEAAQSLAEARNAAAKAPNGFLKNQANAVVRQWENYLKRAGDIGDFMSGRTSNLLPESAIADEADAKAGKKARKVRDPREKKQDEDDVVTFAEEMNIINDIFPQLKLTLEEYLNFSEGVRGALVKDALSLKGKRDFIDKLPAGDPKAALARKALQGEIDKAGIGAQSITQDERTGYNGIKGRLEQYGVQLGEDMYNLMMPDSKAMIDNFVTGLEKETAQTQTVGADPNLVRAARVRIIRGMDALAEAIDVAKVAALGTNFQKFTKRIEKSGASIDERTFNLMSDLVKSNVIALSNRIIKMKADIEAGIVDSVAAQRQIDKDLEAIGKLTEPAENKAKEAGKAFAENMHSAFTDGLKEVIKGGKVGDVLNNLLDTFTNGIIDTFVNAFTQHLTGEKGIFGKLFSGLGSMMYTSGDKAGAITNSSLEQGIGAVTGKGGGFLDTIKGFLGMGQATPKVGMEVATPIVDAAPTIGMDVATPLLDSAPKIGMDIAKALNPAGGATGGAGAIPIPGGGAGGFMGGAGGQMALAGMAGTIFGTLLGKLLFKADGGEVTGPGSGRSDSIPAMLSNGEFVVNAKAAGRNGPLLRAINSNRPLKLADGGMVGSTPAATFDAISAASPMSQSKGKNGTTVNLNITGDISRQTRREIYGALPQIANGVNEYNREKGIS